MLRTAFVAAAAALLVLLPAGACRRQGAERRARLRRRWLPHGHGRRRVARADGHVPFGRAGGARAPFHPVRMTISEPSGSEFHYAVQYVPALGLVRERPDGGDTLWLEPSTRGIEVLDRLTRGLEPVPARRLRGIAPDATTAVAAPSGPRSPSPPDSGGGGQSWLLVLIAPVVAAAAWATRRRWPRLHPRGA